MAIHRITATLESRGVTTAALSKILTRSENEGWEPTVNYESGPGTTLTFDLEEESVDELATKLRAITDVIAESELNN